MIRHAPTNEAGAAETVRAATSLAIVGSQSKRPMDTQTDQISSENLSQTIEWSPDDLVVTVGSGKLLKELNQELATRNQCIPFNTGTAGGLVAANPKVPWDAWPYDARYWVLGLRIVRGDGTVVKCGSKAVKNVAGYDVQKLIVGSWGTLGFITEVTFRVFPVHQFTADKESKPPTITDSTNNADLMLAAKNVFDPDHKFNKGIMGLI